MTTTEPAKPGWRQHPVRTFFGVIFAVVLLLIFLGLAGDPAADLEPAEPAAVQPANADEQAAETDADIGEIGIEEPSETPSERRARASREANERQQADVDEPEPEPEPAETVAQQNARDKAADYLDYSSFSKSGLIEQLEYEGFSASDAEYAVDNVDVNWRDQAVQKARDYLEYSSFSRSGLIEQLEYEGFTTKQATHGVDQTGL